MKNAPTPVLVLDGDMIPSLAVTRSLNRKGIPVDLAHADNIGERPIASYTRHARKTLTYPDPLSEPASFAEWIQEQLRSETYRLILPVTERTLVVLARHPERSAWTEQIPIPPRSALERVLVKSQTLELAESLGVPYPARELVTDIARLEQLAEDIEYPVVLKPQSSISGGIDSGLAQLSVDYAFNRDELLKKGRNLLERTVLLLQQYVRGEGVGVELIAEHGEIRLAFQHRRIHELPLSGGGSCYRESVAVDPALLDASSRLIAALGWHGVAMVEFKRDPRDGRFWLMEINGRFWGSLPLSVAAGADFPWLLYRLYTEGTLKDRLPTVRTGIHCRKLADDLTWYEHVARGVGDPRLFKRPPATRLLGQALAVFTPGHRFDVQSLRDPRPGLVDLHRIARGYLRRVTDGLRHQLDKRRRASPGERRRIARLLAPARRILFVCHGNINRSALAEVLSRRLLEGDDIEVRSAGFHPVQGRPADPNMVACAREQGVDLGGASSTVLDKQLLDWADLTFAMETRHLERLRELSPQALTKAALLGSLAPDGGDPEIPDPYGQPAERYAACYARIERCISSLANIVKPDRLDGQSPNAL